MCIVLLLNLLPMPIHATQAETTSAPESTEPIQTQPVTDNVSVTQGCRSLDAQNPLWGNGKLVETAASAILYEVNSDTMVYSWNPDIQLFPASLVKIMTCLVALENCNLSEKLTVTTTALASLPKDTTLHFVVGETWTLEEYLYCLMVGGFSDAAVVIAEHIAGSQQGFVNMMNYRAQQIGCTGTVFTNATGFHNDKQISTARDIVKILNEALKNEKFMPFFSETLYRLPATDISESKYMTTTNYMMTTDVTAEYYDPRVTGGRTGVTEARERCLIVTAESKGIHYIAIVMGAISTMDSEGKVVRFGNYEEVKELLKKGFDGHQVTQVLSETQILSQFPVTNGENNVTVGPSEDRYTVLPVGITTSDLTIRYDNDFPTLTAPIAAGEYFSTVQIWYGNVCLAQAPVITKNASRIYTDERSPDGKTHEGNVWTAVLWVVAIFAVVALILLGISLAVRVFKNASRRAQHKRRRRNRRRSR